MPVSSASMPSRRMCRFSSGSCEVTSCPFAESCMSRSMTEDGALERLLVVVVVVVVAVDDVRPWRLLVWACLRS